MTFWLLLRLFVQYFVSPLSVNYPLSFRHFYPEEVETFKEWNRLNNIPFWPENILGLHLWCLTRWLWVSFPSSHDTSWKCGRCDYRTSRLWTKSQSPKWEYCLNSKSKSLYLFHHRNFDYSSGTHCRCWYLSRRTHMFGNSLPQLI